MGTMFGLPGDATDPSGTLLSERECAALVRYAMQAHEAERYEVAEHFERVVFDALMHIHGLSFAEAHDRFTLTLALRDL